jgi:large subunit ribosomal protein L1
MLPHGLGKKVRILVFTQGKGVEIAQKAGADYVGGDELIKEIEGGWLDFDIAISTPDMMGKVGKLGRILGRRGLMPNPKSGTIAPEADLPRVIAEARKGRAEYRTDRTANIHVPLGKVSFEAGALLENLAAIAESVVRSKPSGGKGRYIENATLVTSIGPGVKLDLKSIFPQAR